MVKPAAIVAALLASGCLTATRIDAQGFACASDAECDATTSCQGGICRLRGDGGPTTGWPSAETTGVPTGITLTPSGPLTLTTAGQVVDALDVTGCVDIRANDVTIRRTRIRCDGLVGVRVGDAVTGTKLIDVDLIGAEVPGSTGVVGGGLTLSRVDLSRFRQGLEIGERGLVLDDSYLHDLRPTGTPAIGTSGATGLTVRHNRIAQPRDSGPCVMASARGRPLVDLLIDGNLLSGGGWSVHVIGKSATASDVTNARVVNNRFGRDADFGPLATEDAQVTSSNNVFDDDGSPIP